MSLRYSKNVFLSEENEAVQIGRIYFHFQSCDPLLGKQYFLIKTTLEGQISWSEIWTP